MDFTLVTSITAIIVAIIGAYVSLSSRRKNNAEADSSIVSAANSLIEPLKKRVSELETLTGNQEKKINELEDTTTSQHFEIAELRAGVNLLTPQIVSLGQQPLYKPRDKISLSV